MKRITLIGSTILGLGLALTPLTASAASLNRFDAVMLNPQPLPPKEKAAYISHGEEVMLNPQPLPPKIFKHLRVKSKIKY